MLFGGKEFDFGTVSGTIVRDGANEFVHGSAVNGLVFAGGSQSVFFSGTATSTLVSSGAVQFLSGGTASNTQLYGIQSARGTTVSTTVFSGGQEVIALDASAIDTVVSSGGSAFISGLGFAFGGPFEAGTATSMTVSSGGSVTNIGASLDTTIGGGGTFELLSKGGLDGTTVLQSGSLLQLGPDYFRRHHRQLHERRRHAVQLLRGQQWRHAEVESGRLRTKSS